MFCLSCNSILTKSHQKKFCSRSCSASFNNRAKGKKITRSREQYNKDKVNNSLNKYIVDYNEGKLSQRIALRKVLIHLKGYQCSSCNLTEWKNQPIPLELNHIDGNAFNNQPNNLELICSNCHALTPTFKGRNYGRGRKLGAATRS